MFVRLSEPFVGNLRADRVLFDGHLSADIRKMSFKLYICEECVEIKKDFYGL